MQIELEKLQPQLVVASQENEKMMEVMLLHTIIYHNTMFCVYMLTYKVDIIVH